MFEDTLCILHDDNPIQFTKPNELTCMDLKFQSPSPFRHNVLFIVVYELIVFLAYYRKYTRVREEMKEYYAQLRQISGLYEQEDQRLEGRDATGGRGYDDDFV